MKSIPANYDIIIDHIPRCASPPPHHLFLSIFFNTGSNFTQEEFTLCLWNNPYRERGIYSMSQHHPTL